MNPNKIESKFWSIKTWVKKFLSPKIYKNSRITDSTHNTNTVDGWGQANWYNCALQSGKLCVAYNPDLAVPYKGIGRQAIITGLGRDDLSATFVLIEFQRFPSHADISFIHGIHPASNRIQKV